MSMSATVSHEAYNPFGLGDRLAKARKRAGITAGVMAELLGVHRNSISNYETGRQVPSRGTVLLWAALTQQPTEWLLGEDYPALSERAASLLSGNGTVLALTPSISEPGAILTLLVLESARQRFALNTSVAFRSERLIHLAS